MLLLSLLGCVSGASTENYTCPHPFGEVAKSIVTLKEIRHVRLSKSFGTVNTQGILQISESLSGANYHQAFHHELCHWYEFEKARVEAETREKYQQMIDDSINHKGWKFNYWP